MLAHVHNLKHTMGQMQAAIIDRPGCLDAADPAMVTRRAHDHGHSQRREGAAIKKLLDITLGLGTSLGGCLEVGSIATAAQVGALCG